MMGDGILAWLGGIVALSLLGSPAYADSPGYVTLDPARFHATVDGKQVDLFTITNRKGMSVSFGDYGARFGQILVHDRASKFCDVGQRYSLLDAVINVHGWMGAF